MEELIQVRVPLADKRRLLDLARKKGLTLSALVRQIANDSVRGAA
jgi:hypothetical protein